MRGCLLRALCAILLVSQILSCLLAAPQIADRRIVHRRIVDQRTSLTMLDGSNARCLPLLVLVRRRDRKRRSNGPWVFLVRCRRNGREFVGGGRAYRLSRTARLSDR